VDGKYGRPGGGCQSPALSDGCLGRHAAL
jgi:hypothetical protein